MTVEPEVGLTIERMDGQFLKVVEVGSDEIRCKKSQRYRVTKGPFIAYILKPVGMVVLTAAQWESWIHSGGETETTPPQDPEAG